MPRARHLVTTLAMLPHREERSRRRKKSKRDTEERAAERWKWLMRTNGGGKKESVRQEVENRQTEQETKRNE